MHGGVIGLFLGGATDHVVYTYTFVQYFMESITRVISLFLIYFFQN